MIFIFYSPQFGHTDFGHTRTTTITLLGVNLIEEGTPHPWRNKPSQE
jgi:hypothetical protein